jgi:DNA-directed RNA polymerase specialized sigma24 family protein
MSPTLPKWAEPNRATKLESVLRANAEELLWVAEVMAGSRPAGEHCLAEAVGIAEASRHVGREWMLSWLTRLLVHAALRRIGGEIVELLPAAPCVTARLPNLDMSASDRQELRSVPPERIIASFNVLERACFMLYAYLRYPVLDCALLLGCPRAWVTANSERVLAGIIGIHGMTGMASGTLLNPFFSAGVSECAG